MEKIEIICAICRITTYVKIAILKVTSKQNCSQLNKIVGFQTPEHNQGQKKSKRVTLLLNLIKFDHVGSCWIKLDQTGSCWIKLDYTGMDAVGVE